jgi:hypothetical protein
MSDDVWAKLLRVADIETEDYLEVQFRGSYTPEMGPVLVEVLVRDPRNPTRVKRLSPQEWTEIDFPVMDADDAA